VKKKVKKTIHIGKFTLIGKMLYYPIPSTWDEKGKIDHFRVITLSPKIWVEFLRKAKSHYI
jgi:hypothetical protein